MDSLVGYGSDDEVENDRYGSHQSSVDHSGAPGGSRRRDDDTNYDDVNMDMSEDSQAESEPELPQAEPEPSAHRYRDDRKGSADSRSRSRGSRDPDRERSDRERSARDPDRERSARDPDRERSARDPERSARDPERSAREPARRDSPARDKERSDRRDARRDDRYRSERSERSRGGDGPRRGLLGDRPDERSGDSKVPALMDLKPFGGDVPPGYDRRSHDTRDAVSPRFSERSRAREGRSRERSRSRSRERSRAGRRSEERRHKHAERPPPAPYAPHVADHSGPSERRPSPASEYRPSSYKVNKKLEVMEKMGLQIKTPSGSMATAQQLRAAASEPAPARAGALPSYYNASAINGTKVLDQVNKRKLLWANKAKNEQEEAAKWSGTRFAQDNDGRQVSKFMRLMGIKDPAAVKPEPDKEADPIKKQEELFQAMQAQYEVARATTHTMRGVGLGFQRGQF